MKQTMKLKQLKKISLKKRQEKFKSQVGQELILTNQNNCQKFMEQISKLFQLKWVKLEIKQKENLKFYKRNLIKLLIAYLIKNKRLLLSHNKKILSQSIFNDVFIFVFQINNQIIKINIFQIKDQIQKGQKQQQYKAKKYLFKSMQNETNNKNNQEMTNQQIYHQKMLQIQRKHQNEVILTFLNYQRLMKQSSPGNQLYQQNKRIKQVKYYQIIQQKKRDLFQKAIKCNQQFLNEIIHFCEGKQRIEQINQIPISYNSFGKIKTTIKQFFRQWCEQGPQISIYQNIVKKAKKYLKLNDKVLAPGSGLGRLVLQFVEAGFGCQGNEVSYFMLYGSNFILNAVQTQNQYKIYPFLSSVEYYEDQNDIFRSVTIPDKASYKIVSQQADFSMAAGQFTEVYNKMTQQFDSVATCFFIDTANNIFEYVDTIYRTLKKQGIWINYGPLLFHYRQMYNQMSIEISWQILRHYICDKFQFLEQQMQQTSYCHDHKAKMGVKYECISFVCRKK